MAFPVYVRSAVSLSKRVRLNHAKSVITLVPVQATLSFRFQGVAFMTTSQHQQEDLTDTTVLLPPSSSIGAKMVEYDSLSSKALRIVTAKSNTRSSMGGPHYLPTHPEDTESEVFNPDTVRTMPRLPRSVHAVYLRPLKRKANYGVPSCDLQLRSYSVRNVEFFADFALRAAYFLNLPAAGPIPLPRITERWTVPRSNFIYKKSQENFERITLRRLIQIQDGHPDVVKIWLAFLRKHAYHGIGMKANVWNYLPLGVGKTMDLSLDNLKQVLEPKWAHFGRKRNLNTSEKVMEMMKSDGFRDTDVRPFRTM
ncbi:mitochondrial 37S ribosomal protein rsm10 [Xylographa opegraphella]|nr:mitochondrial 37S ribosomal protein rsm10 [Xylographa opegraphella]